MMSKLRTKLDINGDRVYTDGVKYVPFIGAEYKEHINLAFDDLQSYPVDRLTFPKGEWEVVE